MTRSANGAGDLGMAQHETTPQQMSRPPIRSRIFQRLSVRWMVVRCGGAEGGEGAQGADGASRTTGRAGGGAGTVNPARHAGHSTTVPGAMSSSSISAPQDGHVTMIRMRPIMPHNAPPRNGNFPGAKNFA